MNLDYVNDLFALVSEEDREARISSEYNQMMWEINSQWFAQQQADEDCAYFGRMV